MIKIIAKGYKYLLTQIDDFLGSVRTIVISLKSIKGRKEYEQLFGQKLGDQIRTAFWSKIGRSKDKH